MRPAHRSADNRGQILAATRRAFSRHGFRGATLRGIAGEVGVDVALIAHYFGNKQGLFEAAMQMPDAARRIIEDALRAPEGQEGDVLARGYLGLWESEESAAAMNAVVLASLTDEAVLADAQTVLAGDLTPEELGRFTAGRRRGVHMAMAALFGVASSRYIMKTPALVEQPFEEVVRRAGRAVQACLSVADEEA